MQGQRWAGSLQENRSAGREGVCKKEGTSLSQDHCIPAVNGDIDLNIHVCMEMHFYNCIWKQFCSEGSDGYFAVHQPKER